jgi:hypothetical protein
MLLHLQPRLFTSHERVDLIDLRIEPFGLTLRNRVELVVRHPYPNKRYFVACRKVGRVAIDGIYIRMAERVSGIDCTTRWAVDVSHVAIHMVQYLIVDDDFDAATADPILWSAFSEGLGGWSCRYPGGRHGEGPLGRQCKVAMVVTPEDREVFERPNAQGVFSDPQGDFETDARGRIIGLQQKFRMPTVERERLLTSGAAFRHPTIEQAFYV